MNWLNLRIAVSAAYLGIFLFGMASFAEATDVKDLYKEHCVACHGENRLGGIGPALLPENLERLRKPEAIKTIRESRPATQMPAFGDKLKPEELELLTGEGAAARCHVTLDEAVKRLGKLR